MQLTHFKCRYVEHSHSQITSRSTKDPPLNTGFKKVVYTVTERKKRTGNVEKVNNGGGRNKERNT
jgi:hypothetical protein